MSPSPRLVVLALVLALMAGTSLSGSAGASSAATEAITLSIAKSIDKLTKQILLRFTGTVSNSPAGEEVTILQQVCGWGYGTAVAGTQTMSGGFFEAEPPNAHLVAVSGTYWARWRDETSERVDLHPQIPVNPLEHRGKGRLVFTLSIGTARQPMKGKTVLLERLRGETWKIIQRMRLVQFGPAYFRVEFAAPRPSTVRVRVPEKMAAPCFKANSTPKRKLR